VRGWQLQLKAAFPTLHSRQLATPACLQSSAQLGQSNHNPQESMQACTSKLIHCDVTSQCFHTLNNHTSCFCTTHSQHASRHADTNQHSTGGSSSSSTALPPAQVTPKPAAAAVDSRLRGLMAVEWQPGPLPALCTALFRAGATNLVCINLTPTAGLPSLHPALPPKSKLTLTAE
jgi:hypothetical protein